MRDWIEERCLQFESVDGSFETEHFCAFKDYEQKIARALEDFASEENLDAGEVMQRCQQATEQLPGSEKTLELLLASASFPKFVRIMKNKAADLRAKEVNPG